LKEVPRNAVIIEDGEKEGELVSEGQGRAKQDDFCESYGMFAKLKRISGLCGQVNRQ